MLIPGIARCGAIPGAIPALCRAGIGRSCAAFRARFGASTAQGWVVLQAKLLAALCLHAVAMPRLQRLAAQPCGASRVLRTALRAPSPMDGHPAFFRRFQRRRCPPPSTRFTAAAVAPEVAAKKPGCPSLCEVGKRGFAPTLALGRLSASLPACVRVHRGSPTRPAAWTSGWRPRLRGSCSTWTQASWLVDQAPSSGSPGMLPAGPGQLPATPGQGQGYRLRPPGGGQAPGSARQPRYAACLSSGMRLLNQAAQRI